jgi:hypothetical protein
MTNLVAVVASNDVMRRTTSGAFLSRSTGWMRRLDAPFAPIPNMSAGFNLEPTTTKVLGLKCDLACKREKKICDIALVQSIGSTRELGFSTICTI